MGSVYRAPAPSSDLGFCGVYMTCTICVYNYICIYIYIYWYIEIYNVYCVICNVRYYRIEYLAKMQNV